MIVQLIILMMMEFSEDILESAPEILERIEINQAPLVSLQSPYIPMIDEGASIQLENYIEESELSIRVEAEDYTDYLDTTPGNAGGAYRNDDVDLEASGDIGNGFSVGWIDRGEWLTYNIEVPESASYQVIARIASAVETNHSLDISIDGQTTTLNFDSTDGGSLWGDVGSESIELKAGNHELRLEMGSSGFNLNYIDFIAEDNSDTYAQEVLEPIPEPIEASEISIGFQEVVQIPNSGDGSNPSARLNLLADPGDGSGRLFVNDMRGKLYVISNGTASEYMDLTSLVGESFRAQTNQQGFSYFAFHPEFATNGIFYTIHTEDKNTETADFPIIKPIINHNGNIIESSHHSVVREWNTTDPATNIFSGTFRELLRIEQPYGDHDLGQLAFNPNANLGNSDYGMLYIAVSDGGSDGFPVGNTDPLNVGQDLSTILGSIIRIDPFGNNSANGQYGIPDDNPFVEDEDPNTLSEIWAYGLRNPHRFSWDTGGEGKMLIAEIGQAFIEEVNLGIKGANYGWGEREGTWVVDENNENLLFTLPENDEDFGFTYPVAQYDHDIPPDVSDFFGIAIAGGFVYRGQAIPELQGHYIFADFGHDGRFFYVPVDDLIDGQQATIKELRLFDGGEEASFLEIIDQPRSDVRFGIDEEGEIYVTSKQDGKVRKIIPVASRSGDTSITLPSAGNSVEKLVGDFDFIEGPVWHPDGFLLFSDIPGNTIYKLVPNEQPEVFRSPSGNANGNTLDLEGRLITAEHSNRRVSRTEHDGTVITLASEYEGKSLNSPNDLVVKSDGSIYFTDPPYGIQPEDEELGFYGVYRMAPDGTLTLLVDDFVRPNGIAFSPDETKLYVNDSQTGEIRVFDVKPDGTLESGHVFAELKDSTKQGVPDGMKVDTQGNVYSTGPGGVWVFSGSGELLEIIEVPEVAANLAWGDNDYKTLYITATNSIYSIPVQIPNSENIDYDLDEEWFTQSLIEDNLSHWLSAASTDNGFFKTSLNRQWQPAEEQIATLVSQSRLLYVMAEGYQITQEQKYLDAVQKGANFLLENFRTQDGEWYWSVSPEGELIDDQENTYGYASAIFSLSHAYRVTGYEPYLDAALTTASQLDVWDEIKAFPQKRPEDSWSQHDVMHTFEALLALHDATGDSQTLEDAKTLAEFIFDKLYQEEGGYLPEKFDSDWKPLTSENGGYIDVGHQVVWAFLLSRAVEKGFPEQYLNIGQRLLNFALDNGYDHEQGGIHSKISASGNRSDAEKHWWGQSEFLRSVMRYASMHEREELWPKYQQTLELVQQSYLDLEYGGWFSEAVDPTKPINDANVNKGNIWKAGYHVIGMYVQALQLYSQGLVD